MTHICAIAISLCLHQAQDGIDRTRPAGHNVPSFTFEHVVMPNGDSFTVAHKHETFVPDKPTKDSKR